MKDVLLCGWINDFSATNFLLLHCYIRGNTTERKSLKLADCILISILNVEEEVLWFTPDLSVMSFYSSSGFTELYSLQVLKTIIRTNVLGTLHPTKSISNVYAFLL